MRNRLTTVACGIALVFSAASAEAVTIGDSDYVGMVVPGVPANPTDAASYVNYLILMPINDVDPPQELGDPATTPGNNNVFTRSGNTCLALTGSVTCPSATTAGGDLDNQGNPGVIDVSAFQYLYAHYGGDAHVWYVGDLTTTTLPSNNLTGQGLSNWSLFNPTNGPPPPGVPDGGTTLSLLGVGLLGLGYLRRRAGGK